MVTFEISVNGKPLYRTGAGEFGMLTAEVMWARIQQRGGAVHEELTAFATSLAGGGVDCHSQWPRTDLKMGDEILIRIVDSQDFDKPFRSGSLEDLKPDEER
jgi:hypothetical protein